ncbi:hypothetical protein NDU88_010163 [Pleurodeles waltl]|uniref:Uncharacterized protein n=1 Tax=Pleurodeles waltl TaxID=8319 RepID=A0AAV7S0I0_PLEWA|nr:hypothetical protein NDU88_010163 [Pleurodeles waltl]
MALRDPIHGKNAILRLWRPYCCLNYDSRLKEMYKLASYGCIIARLNDRTEKDLESCNDTVMVCYKVMLTLSLHSMLQHYGVIPTLAVGVKAAANPQTGRRPKKWNSDPGGNRQHSPPLYHSDRHGGTDKQRGGHCQQTGGRQCTAHPITTHQSATFSGAGAQPIKTRRKQTSNGKTLTSIHPTRNLDSMEPELHILPAIVYLLLYQEHERRRRRQR